MRAVEPDNEKKNCPSFSGCSDSISMGLLDPRISQQRSSSWNGLDCENRWWNDFFDGFGKLRVCCGKTGEIATRVDTATNHPTVCLARSRLSSVIWAGMGDINNPPIAAPLHFATGPPSWMTSDICWLPMEERTVERKMQGSFHPNGFVFGTVERVKRKMTKDNNFQKRNRKNYGKS